MNKPVMYIIAGIVAVMSAALLYVSVTPSKTAAPEPGDSTAATSQDAASQPDSAPPADTQTGSYVSYTEAAVASTKGTKLIFFHAPWCPQCRSIETSIEKDGVPAGVTVFKADYDSNQALRQKYGVTLQTTFVKVDDAGNKLDLYVAYQEPQFSSVRRALLE